MRQVPHEAVVLIKAFETCELRAYKDVAGVWTIGWGNTRHAAPDLAISQARADAWLQEDLTGVVRAIGEVLKPSILAKLGDDQYGALCSFAFNLGVRPRDHAIWSLINAGQFDRVPARLLLYNKAVVGGKLVPVAGLSRRRRAEAAMWQDDGDEVVLTAYAAEVVPTPRSEKKLSMSRRLWLGLTGAVAGAGQWLTDHVPIVGEWARQLQALIAPQITYSSFLAKLSGGLAIVAVVAGAAVMMLQAKAHKDQKS